jgi:broad specificity phosphatase PhoE/uridine kinase
VKTKTDLILQIEELLAKKKRVVVALDGKATAGKTRLAADLFDRYRASVIHTDDFFLPRTKENFLDGAPRRPLAPPIDIDRFIGQVARPLKEGYASTYDVFSGIRQAFIAENTIAPSGLVIVEGAYSLLPEFGRYYDLSCAVTIDKSEQERRIREREGDYAETFIAHWLPPEHHYQETSRLFDRADFVIELPQEEKTVIYLARHGATESNRSLIIQGHLDRPLADEGRAEAELLAGRAAHLAIDAVISSDLSRAKETAEIICSRLVDVDFSVNYAWREINLGLMQGQTYDHCFKHFAVEMATMKDDPENFQAPGGESGSAVLARIKSALSDLLGKYKNGRLLIVSHGFVLNILLRSLKKELGSRIEPPVARNTAVTKLIFQDEKIREIAYVNDARHLE